MSTLIYYRDSTIADPVAQWDNIEAGIAYVESKIHAYDAVFTYTPFVPDQRPATWVLTKIEIQGLEDRLHTIADYLGIPHLKTTWSGLMPINYNALNHFLMGLMPAAYIDHHFDPDGDLAAIMPEGYDPIIWDIDYLDMFNGGTPDDALINLINPTHEYEELDHVSSALIGYADGPIILGFDVPIGGLIDQTDHFTITGIMSYEFYVSDTDLYYLDGEADPYYGTNTSEKCMLSGLFHLYIGQQYRAQYVHYDGLGSLFNAETGKYIPEFTVETVMGG